MNRSLFTPLPGHVVISLLWVDRHRFDADLDLTLLVDADPDPGLASK
jgi:hypothetical protein